MKVDLEGKVALVTGGAGFIGTAIGRALAASGCRVAYADIDFEAASERAAAMPGCIALRMDVTNESEVEEGIAETVRRLGGLDILVNNAGINSLVHRVTIEEFPLDEWERILRVDLTGLFIVSRAGVRAMLPRPPGTGGRIINISSVLGIVPARLQSPYVASKAGVVNLTRSMAIELGSRGILVNCVAPGSILTEGTRRLFYGADGTFSDHAQAMLSHVPLGRPGNCEEIASAVLFLSSPEASYVNGAVLPVDGGWLAGYIRDF